MKDVFSIHIILSFVAAVSVSFPSSFFEHLKTTGAWNLPDLQDMVVDMLDKDHFHLSWFDANRTYRSEKNFMLKTKIRKRIPIDLIIDSFSLFLLIYEWFIDQKANFFHSQKTKQEKISPDSHTYTDKNIYIDFEWFHT